MCPQIRYIALIAHVHRTYVYIHTREYIIIIIIIIIITVDGWILFL